LGRDRDKEVANVCQSSHRRSKRKAPVDTITHRVLSPTCLPRHLVLVLFPYPSAVFVSLLGALKPSRCTLAKADGRRNPGTGKKSVSNKVK
jgi:hypothetical protein